MKSNRQSVFTNSNIGTLLSNIFLQLRSAGYLLFELITLSEQRKLILLSVLVGLISGVSAFLFKRMIDGVHHICCESDLFREFLSALWYRPLLPAIGGLLAGLLIFRFASEAKGHGVTEVIFSIRRREGRIRPRVALIKSMASALTIGTGGSTGPEGPIIQIGATIGSVVGQWLNLSQGYLRTLVAAGAAGGIAAVFNAPIAAVIFSMEVLLREFTAQAFSMVVFSSVIASVTSHLLLGNEVFLPTPSFGIQHPAELGLYFLLGILAALIAKGFIRIFIRLEETFEEWKKIPLLFRPMIGGFLVGIIGLFLPMILGAGYSEISSVLSTGIDASYSGLLLLFFLMIGKIISTSFTLGSGGSGGILMPSLFIGAMMGSLFGNLCSFLFPNIAPSGAYALVGMGLIFACVVHSPFTAIVMMFEITHDYRIVLPLMFSVTIATVICRQIGVVGLDARILLKRGVHLEELGDSDPLRGLIVGDVMTKKVALARTDMTLDELISLLKQMPHAGYPVVNAYGELQGLITYAEIQHALSAGHASKGLLVETIMRKDFSVAYSGENLADAAKRMQESQLDRILVVEQEDPKRLVGLLTHSNILAAYLKVSRS